MGNGIINIPASYPPQYPHLQPKMPQLIMNLMMNYVQAEQRRKEKEQGRKVEEEIDIKRWERQTKHDITMAQNRQDARRTELIESRQHAAKMQGWKEVDPKDVPMESWGQEYERVGDKFYLKPEQPHPKIANIPGTNHKFLTFRSGGKTHARILDPKTGPEWQEKNQYYTNLKKKGFISEDEYKKGIGVYVKGKTEPMYKLHPGGIQSIEVEPDQVDKFKELEFTKGKFVEKKAKKPTPPSVNQLIKVGEAVIAKGMGMDQSIIEKYDTNKQQEYFATVKMYHKILEKKPAWKNEMGVRKAVDFSVRIDSLATNDKGVLMGKDKESQKWIILE